MPSINVHLTNYVPPAVASTFRDDFTVFVPGIVKKLPAEIKSYDLITNQSKFIEDYYGASSNLNTFQRITYNYVIGLLNCGYSVLFYPLTKVTTDGDPVISKTTEIDTLVGSSDTTSDFIKAIGSINITDKILYDVTFLTDGGLTTSPQLEDTTIVPQADLIAAHKAIYKKLVETSSDRKDCLTIPALYAGCPSENATNFWTTIGPDNKTLSQFCAAPYAPGVTYSNNRVADAAFAFLAGYASNFANTSGNSIYLPPAGVNRMTLDDILSVNYDVTSALMDVWQSSTNPTGNWVNPIIYLRGYGYTVYGQRTLYNKFDHPYLNLHSMIMICLITKKIYQVGTSIMFEPNTLNTWTVFKSRVESYLSKMLSNGGIYDYKLALLNNDNNTFQAAAYISFPGIVEDISIDFHIAKGIITFPESEPAETDTPVENS